MQREILRLITGTEQHLVDSSTIVARCICPLIQPCPPSFVPLQLNILILHLKYSTYFIFVFTQSSDFDLQIVLNIVDKTGEYNGLQILGVKF